MRRCSWPSQTTNKRGVESERRTITLSTAFFADIVACGKTVDLDLFVQLVNEKHTNRRSFVVIQLLSNLPSYSFQHICLIWEKIVQCGSFAIKKKKSLITKAMFPLCSRLQSAETGGLWHTSHARLRARWYNLWGRHNKIPMKDKGKQILRLPQTFATDGVWAGACVEAWLVCDCVCVCCKGLVLQRQQSYTLGLSQ